MKTNTTALIIFIFLLSFSAFGETKSNGETYKEDGLYSVTVTDWLHQTTPLGEQFILKTTPKPITISIQYGSESKELSEESFFKIFKDKKSQKDFAKDIIEKAIPLKSGYRVQVDETVEGGFFGLKMLEYTATVIIGEAVMIMKETTFIGVHKNKILKVTLNFFDGDLTDQSRSSISKFFESLKFEK